MKFTTFERQASLTIKRLMKLKAKIKELVEIPDLKGYQLEELLQDEAEAKERYTAFVNSLNTLLATDSVADFDEDKVESLQDEVADLYKAIQVVVKPFQTQPTLVQTKQAVHSSSISLKLPPLSLKTFNGSPEQWLSFYSIFDSSVNKNSDISNIAKFQYLLSVLEAEPLNLVRNLPLTAENYDVAWKILLDRYKNNRKILIHYVNQLIDLPHISHSNIGSIRAFTSKFQENSQALLALKQDVKKNDIILSTLLLRKLDDVLRRKFEENRTDSQKIPSVQEILDFMENECLHIEAANLSLIVSPKVHSKPHDVLKQNPSRSPRTMLLATPNKAQECVFCAKPDHVLYKCNSFQALSPQDKHDFVKRRRFCFNCLGTSHSFKECKSKHLCSHCKKKHHSWLHLPNWPPSSSSKIDSVDKKDDSVPQVATEPQNPVVVFSHSKISKGCTVLLGTILVQISSSNGNTLVVRAVLDSGAMISCLTENAARLLSLKRWFDGHSSVDGLSASSVKTKGLSKINISALNGTQIAQGHPIVILDKITSNLPHAQVPSDVVAKYKNLVLADPTFYLPSPIDLLIGADLFSKVLTGERIILGDNVPAAMNSVCGYLIMGAIPTQQVSLTGPQDNLVLLNTHDIDLHHALQRFWTLEEPPLKLQPSTEEQKCEDHYITKHSRDVTGRYCVRLPFKDKPLPLGNSKDMAKKRFLSQEKRLNADEKMKNEYIQCMNDYLLSGHMEEVTSEIPEDSQHFFLPHHAVIKNESSTTKVRVVFDASAKSSNGISLNQTLFSGPKLQNNICDILIGFRCHSIVLSCDIKQMFRQIQVHPDDRKFQLLFWREDPTQPLSTYCFTTVVFGFVCSPYLAIRTLKQLVLDEGQKYPLAARVLEKQTYVDDLIFGADSISEAQETQKEIIELLSKGGFDVRKWISNLPELVSNLPESHREKPLLFQNMDNPLYNVLGLKWVSESDQFAYRIQVPEKTPTKRNILSAAAQIYDPCGFLTPVTFWIKSLLQLLWTLGLQWDDPVPSNVTVKWQKFCSQLPVLDKILISRHIPLHGATEIQLHGFSDASEAGYSAVVYVRTVYTHGEVEVSFLIAKSRVAPLKSISIPRLELCGAYLLAELLSYSHKLLTQQWEISSVMAWCDSAVVLSWIQTPPYRLKVYVANRVAIIQDQVPPHKWSHISTHLNPADCASRGLLPSSLIGHTLWWHGPTWLQNSQDTWPTPCFKPTKESELPEIKPDALHVLVTVEEPIFIKDFSSWTKLLRVMAYVLRFFKNLNSKSKETGPLKIEELDVACTKICKLVQVEFREDISRLQADKPASSRIQHLSPFIDKDGLLRVGGRVQQSHLPYVAKHPIIMPKSHHITKLIIDFYHLKYLHAGPQFLQAALSQKFWILSARSAIRSRVHKCVRCFRLKPNLSCQKMGILPEARVTPSKVFLNCGTDFLGPFLVKPNSLRKSNPIKMYICVFICFAVKAVHLEVVSSLSTEAYIAALTRFVSRRGLCANIYSDCGTNFVGAATEIRTIIQEFFKKEDTRNAINKFTSEHQIKFHFLPPAAPHQGGLWERSVKSIKHHLHRVIGKQLLNFEEFLTLTTRIEAILNSRPLTPISSDPSELDCLTPGHFLTGGPLVALPEIQWENTPSNRLSRWQLVQAMTQHLWRRWSQEYLYTLQQRGKWTTQKNNLKLNDLVLIHEPNLPPLFWRLGRVTATSPGPDGLVRVVHLHTAKGTLTRPITKVSLLPTED